jgi:hypothetical protein
MHPARALALAAFVVLGGCGKSEVVPSPPSAPRPAPNSALAHALGADARGRGKYRYEDDGPGCGGAPNVDRKRPLRLGDSATDGAFDFFATERPLVDGPRDAAKGGSSGLRLSLNGPAHVGAGAPIELAVTLANQGTSSFRYALAVDGSLEHWRSPFVDVYVRDEQSKAVYRWSYGASYGRCGNVNARTAADYALLAPGDTRSDPFGEWAMRAPIAIKRPGRYVLWLVYAACVGPEIGVPLGPDEGLAADAFEGTLASNGIVVDVSN